MRPGERAASLQLPDGRRRDGGARGRAQRVLYRETNDPDQADRRRFYKVERWDSAEQHVVELLYASNDLSKAKAMFAAWKDRRPRGRYTLRQGIRVLQRWPPHSK
jgi:hypothetical protein